MSKLGKALDRARHEKEGFLAFSGSNNSGSSREKLGKALEKYSRDFSDDGGVSLLGDKMEVSLDIEAKPAYTTTKVLSPGQDFPENNRTIRNLDDPVHRDSYDFLCTQVLQRVREKRWNSIMISSANPGEGKTLTAINLAMSIAREVNQTALLVGANFRNPKICEYLGISEDRAGLTDYLVNGSKIQDLLFSPGVEKMVVLPTGRKVSVSANILGSPKMRFLVDELKTKYPDRYVIFDCPHVLDMPDSLVFSSYVDTVLLVVEAGKTQKDDVNRAVKTLSDRGVDILGLILNKAQARY